ncbi:MAG TPA: Clp protease N-terminal domain-containing protein [Nocardioidaceae bacterium]|nr:Clp protease N-terminal domain-containing protein [Nocardioidaceae bacterium]
MFERFTKPARTVVSNAHGKALATTSSEIRPEHLLMALLDEPGSLAVRVLEDHGVPRANASRTLDKHRMRHIDGLDEDDAEALQAIGIDLDEVVRRIDRNLGGLAGPAPRRGRPGFSRSAKKALGLALREAIALGHNYIGTEHLLLGMLRSGDRVVADTFAELGLTHRELRAAVADAVRKAG